MSSYNMHSMHCICSRNLPKQAAKCKTRARGAAGASVRAIGVLQQELLEVLMLGDSNQRHARGME